MADIALNDFRAGRIPRDVLGRALTAAISVTGSLRQLLSASIGDAERQVIRYAAEELGVDDADEEARSRVDVANLIADRLTEAAVGKPTTEDIDEAATRVGDAIYSSWVFDANLAYRNADIMGVSATEIEETLRHPTTVQYLLPLFDGRIAIFVKLLNSEGVEWGVAPQWCLIPVMLRGPHRQTLQPLRVFGDVLNINFATSSPLDLLVSYFDVIGEQTVVGGRWSGKVFTGPGFIPVEDPEDYVVEGGKNRPPMRVDGDGNPHYRNSAYGAFIDYDTPTGSVRGYMYFSSIGMEKYQSLLASHNIKYQSVSNKS